MISVADLTLEKFEAQLFLKSQPDLIIRTGGEQRTSNFLSWQSGYSEWFFVDKLLSMGAKVEIADPHRVLVYGPTKLHGQKLDTPDIRAGICSVARCGLRFLLPSNG